MFKVGDKVRVKQELNSAYAEGAKVGDIVEVGELEAYAGELQCIRLKGNKWWHHASRFESICPFKRGDRVLVSDDEERYEFRIFLAYIEGEGASYSYVCVSSSDEEKFNEGRKFRIEAFRYAKPLPQTKEVTLTLTNEQLEKIKQIISEV